MLKKELRPVSLKISPIELILIVNDHHYHDFIILELYKLVDCTYESSASIGIPVLLEIIAPYL